MGPGFLCVVFINFHILRNIHLDDITGLETLYQVSYFSVNTCTKKTMPKQNYVKAINTWVLRMENLKEYIQQNYC